MNLDRALQRNILKSLAHIYPKGVDSKSLPEWHEDINVVFTNLFYLYEHGLVEMKFQAYGNDDEEPFIISLRATHAGMDFFADDGGLSAILGVVTVKLHDETIQALLSSKVEASDLPQEQKQTLLSQIRELRGEAAKHLVTKIIDYGITQGPNAMQWLTEAIKQV